MRDIKELSLKDLEGINLPSDLKEVRNVAKQSILDRYKKEDASV